MIDGQRDTGALYTTVYKKGQVLVRAPGWRMHLVCAQTHMRPPRPPGEPIAPAKDSDRLGPAGIVITLI